MQHPHDQLFHTVFADPRQARPLLRLAVDADLAAAIDWHTFAAAPTDLPDPDLGARRADLRFVALLRDGSGDIHFVPEHKSQQDPRAVVQTLRYALLGWQRALDSPGDRPPGAAPLPPIVAVVVHHDSRPWQVPMSLGELLPPAIAGLPPQPTFQFVLLDLARCSERQLLGLDLLPLGKLCALYLQCLRRMTPDDADAALARWTPVFHAAAATSPRSAFAVFHAYVAKVTNLPRHRLAARMTKIFDHAEGAHVMSTLDKLIAEEVRIERTKALSEGRAKGLTEGRAKLLFQLLQKRFGTAAENVAPRLHAASIEQLDRWALRILDAGSLDEVFAAD